MTPRSRFLRALVRSPRGRAFLLYQLADAEVADEGMVFERLLASVGDPELARIVRKHHEDELRHHGMLLECAARGGVGPMPIPDELRVVRRLDRLLGDLSTAFLSGSLGVEYACALLVVLEERAVREFPFIVRSLREVDEASANVLEEVLEDERRHVKYALAVGRKYAPAPAAYDALLKEFRAAEERAFLEHRVAMTRHALEEDLLAMGSFERALWRAFTSASELGLRASYA